MSIEKMNHYSLTNPASQYDEEALTALELAARTASLVNGCVDAFNKHEHATNEKLKKQDEKITTETKNHVNQWLDEHPEATTTVQDKSIGMEKLTADLRLKVENGYVTPEMFGAVGDGETDDTTAIQSAFDTRMKVLIKDGVYKVTRPLVCYNSVEFEKDAYIEFYPNATGEACLTVAGESSLALGDTPCSVDGATMVLETENILNLSNGDYVLIENDELAAPTCREYDNKNDVLQVYSVGGNVITFTSKPEHEYNTVRIYKLSMIDNVIIDGVKIRCMAKHGYTDGVKLKCLKNATVKNCHVSGFDYAQINIEKSAYCDIHSNMCEVDYSDQLQYGIVVLTSTNVTVYGNKVNSRRTAIDVSWLSNKVTVTGNTVVGNINTHSCTNVTISNNTINDGMILIRGRGVTVTGNSVQNYNEPCIDIEEMGIEGGHIISNNIFKGWCSMKCYLSNITITNNHFIVEKVTSYQNGAFESVIRFFTAGTPAKLEGAIVTGNTFEAVGITPIYCLETGYNTITIKNLVISDNVVRGFKNGLYLPQVGGAVGDNLIVKGNMLFVTDNGIAFRLVNNTQIVGNTIIGSNNSGIGILRYDIDSISTVGLMISGNYVANFEYGVKINGNANMSNAVYMDNIFENCTNSSAGISGNTTRVGNELFALSIDGKVYQLRITENGTMTPTLKE